LPASRTVTVALGWASASREAITEPARPPPTIRKSDVFESDIARYLYRAVVLSAGKNQFDWTKIND